MAKFYTDSSGKRRPISQSLFRPARDKTLAKNISISSRTEAHESTAYLSRRWEAAGSRSERLKLERAAVSAMNRAKVASENQRNSPEERSQMKDVAMIYGHFVDYAKKDYAERYG